MPNSFTSADLFAYYPSLKLVPTILKDQGRRIFLVGGSLRNYLLKYPSKDFDFAVDHSALELARYFSKKIKGVFVLLDEAHGSARVVKKIEGVSFTFDFTDWRAKTIQGDLALRDFTVNTFAVDILAGTAFGQKLRFVDDAPMDLFKKCVRMVDPKVFKADPLRLLRAFSLEAGIGFKIEAKTLKQIGQDNALITTVASERINEEIFKVLNCPASYVLLKKMDKIGLLKNIIPQLKIMDHVKQGGYHHLDVWAHSLEVVAELEKIIFDLQALEHIRSYLQEIVGGGHSRLSLLKMAAILHDIGKPETRKEEKQGISFHGHEHVGERITRQVARQLRLSVKERYFLENTVRLHLRPGYLSNFKVPSEKAIFRYLRDTKDEAASLSILALADQAATRGPLTTQAKHSHHAKICYHLIDRYFELKKQKPKLRLLNGDDLINKLKMKPSALFGKILAQIDEAAALGKIKTKEQALDLAREML